MPMQFATYSLPKLERYPQRLEPHLSPFDAGVLSILSYLRPLRGTKRPWGDKSSIVQKVNAREDVLPAALEDCLAELPALRRRLRRRSDNLTIPDGAVLLAFLKRMSKAALGQRPYDVQVAAVWSLMRGEIAEMGTGEGKSLTAAVAAAALALCGRRVHVLTVNDYLAARDAQRFEPLFTLLGLSSGCIDEAGSPDERREIYQRDIVFSAAKNIVFDYLRDQTGPASDMLSGLPAKLAQLIPQVTGQTMPILQGLDAVIVDEADSVLIDQAATPFILSGGEATLGGLDAKTLARALELARRLEDGRHFKTATASRRITLSDSGKMWLASWIGDDDGLLSVAPIREHIISQALVALHMLIRDRDYLIDNEKVQIIDESTGRVMPDRQWSEGLHQLVELKEGLEPSELRTTLGRITFQRFFPRYRHVCGMSGTARPAARELWESYGLTVRRIRPRKPDQKHWAPVQIFRSQATKWQAIGTRVHQFNQADIPVLIGTRTLEGSRQCSVVLTNMGIPHHVLNAEEVAKEAMIVALAGEPGQVTVATNMAGRGTDIVLSDQARAAGGLHVILTELHENRRIDLQLAGRCGRQGDPGHIDYFLSLEDNLFETAGPAIIRLVRIFHRAGQKRTVFALMRALQGKQTRRAETSRRRLQKYERQRERSLALSGTLE
ncbi:MULTISPECIES: translocase [unclassified Yoonia]|uniref:preprotein translocase subunit SecA n=1 Tax=unclassified Yoonia TaxID=2629118 RepID=UPI002AFDD09B|nr:MULTISPECIES: translocase [unclassified Yoonia]